MIQTTIVKKEIVSRLSRYKDINISVGVPAADVGCVGDARVRGRCFDVSGALSVRANMRMYLQPDNAKHRLVVSYKPNAPEANPPLPHELAKIIYSDINKVVWGDFNVCPLRPLAHEGIQSVCIQSAHHLIVK